jgi:cellobiose dehydrogenase (acceptor)
MDMINGDCNSKKDVFSYPPLNTANGLRDGPVRSYLPLAQNQKDFKLMLRTKVIRAVRHGPVISGVETETSTGDRIIYNVKAGGSVVFAGGALSTPRLLFNSGIGPTEQLQFVASGTTGVTLPAKSDWIILPVGAEVKDHTIFTVKFKTNSTMYSPPLNDTLKPNQTSIDLFAKGSGLLSQSGQRLTFWTSVNTTCGTEVFIQGTCNGPANNTIQMKIYLTHGLTSVGSLGITPDGATEFITNPWMNTKDDSEAITIFMDRLLKMTQASGSTLSFLSAGNVTASSNITGADLTKEHVTGSHYVGTAKMGTKGDPGVVVDTDTKVYGTDNLFVVDASIHPDLPIGNTQAIVMVAAEKAAERILACGRPPASQTHASSTDPSVGTSISHPVPNGTNPSLAPTSVSPNAPAQPPTQTSRPYQNDQLSQFTHTSSKALTAPAQSLSQTSRPYENAQPTQYAQGPDKADDYNHRP